MKILHVITSLYTGGAEKLMVDLLPRLRGADHEVELLLFNGADTPFRKELQKSGIRIMDCGSGNSVYSLKNLRILRKILGNYDIIHTHNSSPQFFAAIAGIWKSVKLVTTEHNTNNRRRNWPGFSMIDRWMYNRYDSVICISDKAEENLRDYLKTDKRNIRTIYNGIDTSKFRNAMPSEELKKYMPADGKAIMMVAAFRHQKNQEALIKAMDYLPEKFHLFLVGEGERKNECIEAAKNSKATERIHFLGRRSDIPELLKASDFVVLSSHYEGLSLSSIEGMSVGRPFLASNVDGLHEVVDGAGILFEDGDSKGIADEVLRLDKNPEYYKEVAEKCLVRATKYDISSMLKEYMAVYDEVIK